jgi:methylmalonyl-CoA mutase, N-terminal domain
VLGGTQSLHTDSFDEALALPTEDAATIALRTQQIIAHETGVANVIDPLAGSYYLEKLTDEVESQAMRYITQIRNLGGVVKALEHGFFSSEIGDASYRYQREVDSKKRIIVGVNEFSDNKPLSVPIQLVDKNVERIQDERLAQVRRERDAIRHSASLEQLRKVAVLGQNTMPAFLECAHAYATLGEMMDVLRGVYGVYEEPVAI